VIAPFDAKVADRGARVVWSPVYEAVRYSSRLTSCHHINVTFVPIMAGPESTSFADLQWNLPLFDDLFLSMQGQNVMLVDFYLRDLERDLLRELVEIERTPFPATLIVSALSQMWIFAVYELLRTALPRLGGFTCLLWTGVHFVLCVLAASSIRLSGCSNFRGPHARVHRFCFLPGSQVLDR
jgi:hypothetical protein